jgi:hypothetical protein
MLVKEYNNSPFRKCDLNRFYDEEMAANGKPPDYFLFEDLE